MGVVWRCLDSDSVSSLFITALPFLYSLLSVHSRQTLRSIGFQDWVAGSVETGYRKDEHFEMLAGWFTEVHVLNSERTPLAASYYDHALWTLADANMWATTYPHATAQCEAAPA